jgi:hypothetical protein
MSENGANKEAFLATPFPMTKEYNWSQHLEGIVLWSPVKIILAGSPAGREISLVATGLARPQGLMNGNEIAYVYIETGLDHVDKVEVLRFPNSPDDRHVDERVKNFTLSVPLRDVKDAYIHIEG